MDDDSGRAGWAQVPWVGVEWPPMNQAIDIRLTPAEWRWLLGRLGDDLPTLRDIGDAESEQLVLDAIAAVTRQLGKDRR